jgi:hypothetical protein
MAVSHTEHCSRHEVERDLRARFGCGRQPTAPGGRRRPFSVCRVSGVSGFDCSFWLSAMRATGFRWASYSRKLACERPDASSLASERPTVAMADEGGCAKVDHPADFELAAQFGSASTVDSFHCRAR